MNIIEKTQPPSGLAIISTEGLTPLVLSSFLPLALKDAYPKTKVYLFTTVEAAQHSSCFHFDGVVALGQNRAQNTAQLLFHAKIKRISRFIDLDTHQPKYFNFSSEIIRAPDPEKYIQILQVLGIKPEKINLKLKVKAEIFNSVRHELIDKDFNLKNIFIAAPEGEGFSHKSWKSFDSVLKPWLQNNNKVIIIPGENTWENIQKLHGEFPKNIFLWRKRSFEETVALISLAKHFVGADSLWTHVASQLGVETTAVLGPSRMPSSEFLQLRKNLKIFKAGIPCSPCQKGVNSYDFSCGDNVCMKSHSPEQIRTRVYLP